MSSLHIALVEPEIPWNTGNVGRTCLAVDAQLHLIEPLGFSLAEREVRRAGLDYWPRVRLRVWRGWAAFAEALPDLGEPFFFSAAARRRLFDVRFPSDTVLVFGRESVGLPRTLLEAHPDRLVAIPMVDPEVRSLNLSTAAAVAAFEVVRQWDGGGVGPAPSPRLPGRGWGCGGRPWGCSLSWPLLSGTEELRISDRR
jgi:tRNA (cytidine/uridine-2'-O-)-methyltransferase